jgi:plastocyanin
MLIPSVTVQGQAVVDGKVTIAEVVSDGPGWLVVHAQVDGKPGPVLGYSPVKDGVNSDVIVELDVANATETLYAMLHTDAGQTGTYEFPGPDGPVSIDGQVVTPAFQVSGLAMLIPAVSVSDQEIAAGSVTVAEVVSDGPGWLVVHAQADGKPGPVLGYSPVKAGVNSDVVVQLDIANATETLYAMLHTDAGQVGTYEFPGNDVPVTVEEQVVTPAFQVSGLSSAAVMVEDQEITDGTVTIAEVVSDGPGWLVVHAQLDGKPGPVLGYSPVKDGVNSDVVVELDMANATGTLYAMLHTDAGQTGTYEFPGDDAPVKAGENIVMAPFNVMAAEGEVTVNIVQFAFDPVYLVVQAGTTVTWVNQDTAQHTTTADDNLWDSGLYGQGESFSFSFEQPGIYPYYCIPHGAPGGVGMAATIVVLP